MNDIAINTLSRIIKSLLLSLLIGSAITVPIVASNTAGNSTSAPLAANTSDDSTETPGVTSTITGTQTVTATASATFTSTLVPTATATVPITGTTEAKVTICHRTGSAHNPYVEITVSRDALPAHSAHGDIIPAPVGGCPSQVTGTPTAQASPTSTPTLAPTGTGTAVASPTTVAQKVTICHATGSVHNPYVLITVDANGLNGHAKHPGDIIPAPPGGCPTSQQQPTITPPNKGKGGGNGQGNGNGNQGGNGRGNGNQGNQGKNKP